MDVPRETSKGEQMTTQLAIGYLAAGRGKGFGPVDASGGSGSTRVTGRDAMSGRPAIPQAVIDWPDDASADVRLPDVRLPVGAGDPAVGVEGPLSFRGLGARERGRISRLSVDATMVGVVAVLLIGLSAAVAKAGGDADVTAVNRARTPVVEVRVMRIEPATALQAASPARPVSKLAGAGRAAAVN